VSDEKAYALYAAKYGFELAVVIADDALAQGDELALLNALHGVAEARRWFDTVRRDAGIHGASSRRMHPQRARSHRTRVVARRRRPRAPSDRPRPRPRSSRALLARRAA